MTRTRGTCPGPDTTQAPHLTDRGRARRWAAFAVIYVVWGSTYLAIRVMDRSIPPLAGASARFLAALLVASEPLWVIVWRAALRERVGWLPLAGVMAGLAGVAVLVLPGGGGVRASPLSIALLLGVALSYATGSIWYPRLPMPADTIAVTAAEMLTAGAVLGGAGLAAGQFTRPVLAGVIASSVWALVYLTGAGSLLAYTAYLWLLGHAPVTQVTTYAYVNPVIAVILGTTFLSEQLTVRMAAGAVLTLSAVALIARTGWAA